MKRQKGRPKKDQSGFQPVKEFDLRDVELLSNFAHYNLGIDRIEDLKMVPNPLLNRTQDGLANPDKELLRLMRNPDYFYFTCKYVFNIEIYPFQALILKELYTHTFPMLIGSRGLSKTFLLALYAWLVMFCNPGSKVALVGAGYRQSKILFEYMERIWMNAPVLRSISANHFIKSGPSRQPDKWTMTYGDSIAFALPVGDGNRIRGLRATHLVVDEFAAHNKHIYENVIQGFASVSADPVQNAKQYARIQYLKERGLWSEDQESNYKAGAKGNQTILSGTAYYSFNHFYEYFVRYRKIINSKGDFEKLNEIFRGEVDPEFDYKQFCIIRVPYNKLPPRFMDDTQIQRSRLMTEENLFKMEYLACFSKDSDGFFKRSLIEACVTNEPIYCHVSGEVKFRATLRGSREYKYIYGVDSASQADNLSIVILEIHPDHRRVVYCWTINQARFNAESKKKKEAEKNYTAFCARKIRDLMKVFPTEHIVFDAQGGGYALLDALHDPDKLKPNEKMIWPLYSYHPLGEEKYKEYDDQAGSHIVEMFQPSRTEEVSMANHGLKKDLSDKYLLFPYFDYVEAQATFERKLLEEETGQASDDIETVEDCQYEIEELKNELSSIVITNTSSAGREHFDTPDKKREGDRKGRMKKDRYSSLLMANWSATKLLNQLDTNIELPAGGFATESRGGFVPRKGGWANAPEWFTNGLKQRGGMAKCIY